MLTLVVGCSASSETSGGAGGSASATGNGGFGATGGSGGFGASGGSGGFGAVGGGGGTSNNLNPDGGPDCDTDLIVTVRDFTEMHPDFESYLGALTGIVQPDLGPDSKPVYALPGASVCTTGAAEFASWYRDTDGVNMRVPVTIQFTETSPGVFVYDNQNFFPIDGMGFGNGPNTTVPVIGTVIPATNNYLFTTEIHTLFTYKGGEVFTFRGDDDLWIFVNKKLAIDLGGVHGPLTGTLDMNARAAELGITIGQTYPMDIFQAERHTVGSSFRIETTIDFTCVVNIPPLD